MKTAIVYDRVNKWGGAERVLLALHEMFPKASLFTSVYSPSKAPWAQVFPEIHTATFNRIKLLRDKHQLLGAFMPVIFESFNFDNYDLVVSVTSESAKGVITSGKTKHICYCLTPTRYLWSHYDTYFKGRSFKGISRPVVSYLRRWDKQAAQRPDVMVAISSTVKDRIKKYYGRDSQIIHPPLTLPQSSVISNRSSVEPYFLLVSRLVPYKKVDLAIKTFNKLGEKLFIVGTGSEERKLKKMAGPNIKFLGQLTDRELHGYYKNAKALIFPQEEDFGLVAVEAISRGTPVIAYKRGGALDIVTDRLNGLFFEEESTGSLKNAIRRFETIRFNANIIKTSAKKFSKENFKTKFVQLL